MEKSSKVFKAGARKSKLAVLQTDQALRSIEADVPSLRFERVGVDTPGDRDLRTDLRVSPPDFFTRDLDDQVLSGAIDCAIHSAKDLPEVLSPGLDFVWLPAGEDSRDVLVVRAGLSLAEFPDEPRIGVSSERRGVYAAARWAGARLLPLRGTIEERIRQMDEGQFDALVMAGAALIRLGLVERIVEWIPLADLPAPAGQGRLAMTFRANDPVFLRLRSLYVPSVRFVGSGIGRISTLTLEGQAALREADVCLHDELLPEVVLDFLPKSAERINVGKRAGVHSHVQAEISERIAFHARRGKRVVRLKGGDPTLFGRLAEEIDTLERYRIPYCVLPGVSSHSVASAESGILLTRRGTSRGVTFLTPRQEGGTLASIGESVRRQLPLVFYMATRCTREVSDELLAEGLPPETPAAVVFDAGADEMETIRGTLKTIADSVEVGQNAPNPSLSSSIRPGLLIVGEAASHTFSRDHGALMGARVLLTCSDTLMEKASRGVMDMGGKPLPCSLFRLIPEPTTKDIVAGLSEFDWLILTSPASVRCLMDVMRDEDVCVRELPAIAVTGAGTAAELKRFGIIADLVPDSDFSADGLVAAMKEVEPERGHRVLRLRSEKAGESLAQALQDAGYTVTDRILYRNVPITVNGIPSFDAVMFASASAVEQFGIQVGVAALNGKPVVAIGQPTALALKRLGIDNPIIPAESTVDGALYALAADCVNRTLESSL